jgi:hypothetical protein
VQPQLRQDGTGDVKKIFIYSELRYHAPDGETGEQEGGENMKCKALH